MEITIQAERPDTPDAVKLIDELTEHLSIGYPPEHRFGYSVQKMIDQGVQFYLVRVDGKAAGCGGVQIFDEVPKYGEIKRMYVRPEFRGLGIAKKILKQLQTYTEESGATLFRLETGRAQGEAIGLYKKWGFVEVGPFGDYQATPNNVFYEMPI